ncbi:MAG: acyltransferase [Polyangiales bacterium]
MRYQPSLDGVRAISVLIVMAYHFDLNSWGHLGVAIFFVLSGFLTTSILMGQRDQKLGRYLAVFYQRRTLRIFPLYYGYIALLGMSFLLLGRPTGFDTNWPYLVTYTSNFAPLDPDWFTSAFYGHLWSLAVEEQFYLIWPFLIYFMSAKGSKTLMIVLLIVCPLIRIVGYSMLSEVAPVVEGVASLATVRAVEAMDGLPVSCWDAFAAGALIPIAALRTRSRQFWARYVTILALATAAFGAYLLSSRGAGLIAAPGELFKAVLHDRFIGYSIRNLWIVCFLIGAMQWRPLRAVLSLPWMVLVGRVSYGMYIFHWPILVPIRRVLSYEPLSLAGIAVFLVYTAIVFAVSYASYRWFESWFLRRKRPYAETQ